MDYYINDNLGNGYPSLEYPLIHICNNIQIIESIIKHGFRFSYCKESFCNSTRRIELLFPLISFSQLNWSTASELLKSYGQIGIAMRKEWVVKNGLTPVLYFERNSNLTNTIMEGIDVLRNVPLDDIESSIRGQLIGDRHKYYKQTIEILSYSKNFYGPLIRKNKIVNKEYCFGCESEWRIVLKSPQIMPLLFTNSNIKEANKIAQSHFLTFDFEDIEYFVIEQEFEEERIKNCLMEKFGKNEDEVSSINYKYNDIRLSPDEC